ncbi:DUF5780 domain-containing protein [Mammaliicoccus sciuri]|uniref:DUF5780 domain-containing protein n=1 Tax=Mammaliicoccus sciuri TaxID=1296 RepID=UPI003B9E438C
MFKIRSIIAVLIILVLTTYGCSQKENAVSSEKEVTKNDSKVEGKSKVKKESNTLNAQSLENNLENQDIVVENGRYLIRSEEYKSLYPDALQAYIRNNTGKDIKDITFGFVAWDKNGLPIKIKRSVDFSDGNYFSGVKGEAVNIAPGDLYGEDTGMELDKGMDIEYFKPIIASYEDFEGNTWENKELKNFLKIYEGKRLKDIEGYEDYIFYKNN